MGEPAFAVHPWIRCRREPGQRGYTGRNAELPGEGCSPTGGIAIDRPEIYFGEQTPSYVVVNTKAEEFDYPRGDQNVFSTYTGTGGIRMASWWRRLALAWNLGDLNMLASSYLTSDSQLLMRRMIRDRVRRLAPFLKLDRDPYIVAADGRLVWIIDAYTTSDRYPYAQRTVERGTDADFVPVPGGGQTRRARLEQGVRRLRPPLRCLGCTTTSGIA